MWESPIEPLGPEGACNGPVHKSHISLDRHSNLDTVLVEWVIAWCWITLIPNRGECAAKRFRQLGLFLIIAALVLMTMPAAVFAKDTSSVNAQPAHPVVRQLVVGADRSGPVGELGTIRATMSSSCPDGSWVTYNWWGIQFTMSECMTQAVAQASGGLSGLATMLAIAAVRIPVGGWIIAAFSGIIAGALAAYAGTIGFVDAWFCNNKGVSVGISWAGVPVSFGCRPGGGGAGGGF